MENLELNLEEIYFEVKEKAEAEGAFSREEWDDLIDDALEERRQAGVLHEDDDLEAMRESLRSRYEEFEETVPEL